MAVRRILTLITCWTIAPAIASPRSDPTTGRAVFTGAATPHATSTSLNPAALGTSPFRGVEFYLAVTSTLQQLGIERRTIDPGTGALSPGPQVTDTQLGPGGNLGLVWHSSDRLTLGFEARVPPPEMLPDRKDPLRYHTLGEAQRNYLATVGVSLRVTSKFHFGASLSHENTFLRLRYARDTALEAGRGPDGIESDCGGSRCGVENPEATELYDVDVASRLVSTSNLKVHLGTVFSVYPDVWIGVAYHTPPGLGIQTTLDGTMDVTRAPRDGGEVVRGGASVNVSFPASVDGEIRARLPEDLELHVGVRWEDLSRMQAYDVRGYGSTFRNAGIPEWTLRPRGLRDAVAVWAGVEQYDRGQRVRLGARLGFETASVTTERTSPGTIGPPRVTIDVGGQVRLGPWIAQLSYGLALSPRVSVEDSDYDPRFRLDCLDTLDYTSRACEATRNGYAIPTAAGDYSRLDHALRLGFRYEYR
jgi:long-subunit fatty acid transport protein